MFDIGADLQRAFDEGYEKGKADRPQGEWLRKDGRVWSECSACGSGSSFETKFCGNCGAKMKGEKK